MKGWEQFRKEKYRKYQKAKEDGEVDQDIISLLDLINSSHRFITLSSCSGRIGVLDTPKPGDKLNSTFLAKWHHITEPQQVIDASKRGQRKTWLINNPPILHVACKNLRSAGELMEIANNAGFSSSGVISLKKIIVEISSHERMEVPLSTENTLLIHETSMKAVVSLANEKLEKGKQKLVNLENILKDINL